jgi:hypothetical protein
LTQERFISLLREPNEGLATITYEELKTLALAYPYAQNFRTLLALKARQEEHPEAMRILATAAASALDRTQLFLLVQKSLVPTALEVEEEIVFELKPIETVQRRLEALETIVREESPTPAPEMEMKAAIVEEAPAPISNPVPTVVPQPTPKTTLLSFQDWMGQFHAPILEAPEPSVPATLIVEPATTLSPTPDPAPPAGNMAQKLAERSVAENKDVISETLAKLLVKQGYRDKAISMYERLSLAFPEKNTFFAAEIEKLKKN